MAPTQLHPSRAYAPKPVFAYYITDSHLKQRNVDLHNVICSVRDINDKEHKYVRLLDFAYAIRPDSAKNAVQINLKLLEQYLIDLRLHGTIASPQKRAQFEIYYAKEEVGGTRQLRRIKEDCHWDIAMDDMLFSSRAGEASWSSYFISSKRVATPRLYPSPWG